MHLILTKAVGRVAQTYLSLTFANFPWFLTLLSFLFMSFEKVKLFDVRKLLVKHLLDLQLHTDQFHREVYDRRFLTNGNENNSYFKSVCQVSFLKL